MFNVNVLCSTYFSFYYQICCKVFVFVLNNVQVWRHKVHPSPLSILGSRHEYGAEFELLTRVGVIWNYFGFMIMFHFLSSKNIEETSIYLLDFLQNFFEKIAKELWFDDDGSLPCFGRQLRNYVSGDRWIRRDYSIVWWSRSSDLSTRFFFGNK